MTTYVDRKKVIAVAPDTYGFLEHEGLNHKITEDEDGTFRWEWDPVIEMLYDAGAIDLNKLHLSLARKFGASYRNDPTLRDFYRRLGYSVYGYWEIFHWEMNNEYADEYEEPDVK